MLLPCNSIIAVQMSHSYCLKFDFGSGNTSETRRLSFMDIGSLQKQTVFSFKCQVATCMSMYDYDGGSSSCHKLQWVRKFEPNKCEKAKEHGEVIVLSIKHSKVC